MIIDYMGVREINGSLIVMDGVKGVSFEEIVDIRLENGVVRQGRVVQIDGERIVVQVFEGTKSKLYKHGYFEYRYAYDPYKGTEASDIFRLWYEAQ